LLSPLPSYVLGRALRRTRVSHQDRTSNGEHDVQQPTKS
jgi:hypothetical protein